MKKQDCRGFILEVDLGKRSFSTRETPRDWIEGFLGGRGLGARLMWETKPGVAADDPENPLIFCPGLLNAYPTPGTPRSEMITKSPATRPMEPLHSGSSSITYSNLGGFFGTELKFAGVDALIIKGKAPRPTMLVADFRKGVDIRFEDASDLWGLSSKSTELALRKRLGQNQFKTVYIGPAGEKLVRFASIMHKISRAFARGGGGFVMGSKNLKAIAIRGRAIPAVADYTAYRKAVSRLRDHFKSKKDSDAYQHRLKYASLRSFKGLAPYSGFAVRNFSQGYWEVMLDFHKRASRHWVHENACYACPIPCRKTPVIKDGPFPGHFHDSSHFEHAVMLGSNCGQSDERVIPRLSEACNELGIDVISTGNILGFLMDAKERGLLPEAFCDGIDLRWDNPHAMLKAIEKIGRREGLGDILAQGLGFVAKELGSGVEKFAFESKGLEFPGWNPKGYWPIAISYMTSNRGACHLSGDSMERQNQQAVKDAVGSCFFVRYITSYKILAELVSAVVGSEYDEKGIYEVGDRIYNLEKSFNYREGFRRADDSRLPEALCTEHMKARKGGRTILEKAKFERMLTSYYNKRGWNPRTSQPERKTIERLGLGFVPEKS